jgi:hypothetical protein
LQWG